MAIGTGFPETGSQNRSGIHWALMYGARRPLCQGWQVHDLARPLALESLEEHDQGPLHLRGGLGFSPDSAYSDASGGTDSSLMWGGGRFSSIHARNHSRSHHWMTAAARSGR